MTTEETPKPTEAEVATLVGSLLQGARHPGSLAFLVFLAGPVSAYIMTTYVSPEIRKGIEVHKVDGDAHPEQFERLDALSARMGALEKRYETDTTELAVMLSKVADKLDKDGE